MPDVLPPVRANFWVDRCAGGRLTTAKPWDARTTYTIDASDRLPTGETASSIASSLVSGPTVHALSTTGPGVITLEVSGAGTMTATITTSGGDKIVIPIALNATDTNRSDIYA